MGVSPPRPRALKYPRHRLLRLQTLQLTKLGARLFTSRRMVCRARGWSVSPRLDRRHGLPIGRRSPHLESRHRVCTHMKTMSATNRMLRVRTKIQLMMRTKTWIEKWTKICLKTSSIERHKTMRSKRESLKRTRTMRWRIKSNKVLTKAQTRTWTTNQTTRASRSSHKTIRMHSSVRANSLMSRLVNHTIKKAQLATRLRVRRPWNHQQRHLNECNCRRATVLDAPLNVHESNRQALRQQQRSDRSPSGRLRRKDLGLCCGQRSACHPYVSRPLSRCLHRRRSKSDLHRIHFDNCAHFAITVTLLTLNHRRRTRETVQAL